MTLSKGLLTFREKVKSGKDLISKIWKVTSEKEDDHVYILEKENSYYTIYKEESSVYSFPGKVSRKSIGILIYLLNPCSEIEIKQINKTLFDDQAMIDLLFRHSTCIAPYVEQKQFTHKAKTIIKPIIRGGYSYQY